MILVIVRHGIYAQNGFLKPLGEEQIRNVMKKLIERLVIPKYEAIGIFASQKVRAIQSALIGIALLQENKFYCPDEIDGGQRCWEDRLNDMKSYNQFNPNAPIFFFAHLEDLEGFAPRMFSLNGVPEDQNNYGTALIIDTDAKTTQIIQPD